MMRRKCGAHLARISKPSARPTGVDQGSSKPDGAGSDGARPSIRWTHVGGPCPTPWLSAYERILTDLAEIQGVAQGPPTWGQRMLGRAPSEPATAGFEDPSSTP